MIRRFSTSGQPAGPQVPVPIEFASAPCEALPVDFSCRRRLSENLRHPHQVVGGSDDQREQIRSVSSFEPASPHPANCLAPAEDLFDPFAQALAGDVTPMPSCATVDRRTTLMCD